MATVVSSLSLEQFKSVNNASTLDVYTSKKGKKYAINHATGKLIAWVALDLDKGQPIRVLEMTDSVTDPDTGEIREDRWNFICNGEERVPEDTL